jgi:hypothetical protein
MVACIQPNLSSGEAVGWPRIPDRPGSWRFVLDGLMTPWSFDAFGSGSYASRRVGFSGPTMVLSETRGAIGSCSGWMVGYSSIATIGLRPPPDNVGRQKRGVRFGLPVIRQEPCCWTLESGASFHMGVANAALRFK